MEYKERYVEWEWAGKKCVTLHMTVSECIALVREPVKEHRRLLIGKLDKLSNDRDALMLVKQTDKYDRESIIVAVEAKRLLWKSPKVVGYMESGWSPTADLKRKAFSSLRMGAPHPAQITDVGTSTFCFSVPFEEQVEV